MGIFDKAKGVLHQHGDKVDSGLDTLAGLADERTGNRHGEQIDKGVGVAKEKLADRRAEDPLA